MLILTRDSPDVPVGEKRQLMKESLDLHAWWLGLISPGGIKVLDGHSWQAPPKLLGSVATRSETWLICVPFMNANKEFYNVRQEVLIFRSTPDWLTFAPPYKGGSARCTACSGIDQRFCRCVRLFLYTYPYVKQYYLEADVHWAAVKARLYKIMKDSWNRAGKTNCGGSDRAIPDSSYGWASQRS